MTPSLDAIDLGPATRGEGCFVWDFDVSPLWIDYNNHLGARYYAAIFIEALTRSMEEAGLGRTYAGDGSGTFVAIEARIQYHSEVRLERARVSTRVRTWAAKRLTWRAHLHIHPDMRLASTYDMTAVHIDQASRKAKPIPPALLDKLAALHDGGETQRSD